MLKRSAHRQLLLIGLLAVSGAARVGLAADGDRAGVLPAGADGKPLNFDFEKGTLADWQREGDAFAGTTKDD